MSEKIAILGIDLSKTFYQVHGNDARGKCQLRKCLKRPKLIEFIANLPKCVIAMEACAGANFFARKFKAFGHEVRLIAPQYVKPYVKGNKNDSTDAEAICEAATRPRMNFVATKNIWQQDLQSIQRIRQRLLETKTALTNEIRGLLYEFGIVIPKGQASLHKVIQGILNKSLDSFDLSEQGFQWLQSLYSELIQLDEKIAEKDKMLQKAIKNNEDYKRLKNIGGLGPISISALMVALGNPSSFKNGRQFAAWAGLVPRHSGTGGKNRILGISKRGNPYLRSLLVHGARAKLRAIILKAGSDQYLDPLSKWVLRLYAKKGWNKACVALANKNARIAWAIMNSKSDFKPSLAAMDTLQAA